MTRLISLSAAAAALAFASPAMANGDGAQDHVEGASAVTTSLAAPVKLVSWDGDFELEKTSRRLRIWRTHIAYRLTVDAEGNATECELTESFRLRHVSIRLCDVLMAHHTFEPAHDETGTAVEGSYSHRMSYKEIRERL